MILDKIKKAIQKPASVPWYLLEKSFQAIGKRINYGEPVLDKEWDVLVILDACRYDMFVKTIEEHPIKQY